MKLRGQIVELLSTELRLGDGEDVDAEFYAVLERVTAIDPDLAFAVEEAHNAGMDAYSEAAFALGFQIGRDPAILVFEPAGDCCGS